ncbi:FtsK/SpoIIIE domain-containing protein [Nocardioides jiangxiensis]|uniref:FtsK/SpoIIIE domain-containing protein n=1 Tax=Nocardioides jiangxiensis TaxID=3064524 RepID=A0ABT9B4D1_9ACTN|nr:FtsK/SpoIIIE domain-containing protein [Nocardioides sp. WY-20]MDO7868008.1 FtsK/SpoIIIE domain-containing protein [Nocardioides sp. WY-20]
MTITGTRTTLRLPAAPPQRPPEGGGLLMLLPALGGLGSVALVAGNGLGSGGPMRLRSLLAAGLFLLVTVAFVVLQVERQVRRRRAHAGQSRDDHRHHLARARQSVVRAADLQRAEALDRHPAPATVVAHSPDPGEHLTVRIGVGTGRLGLDLELPEPIPGQPSDLAAQLALERFVEHHRHVRDLPVAVDLAETGDLVIDGPGEAARAVARAWVCSAARIDPARLRIAVLADDAEAFAAWEWLKWLPHHGSPTDRDDVGPARLRATSLQDLLPAAGTHHLLVIDERRPAPTSPTSGPATTIRPAGGPVAGATTVSTGPAARVRRGGADVTPADFRPDTCDLATATASARRRAALVPPSGPGDLAALLRGSPRMHLRVPIGTGIEGAPVHLDLRETAEGGHGPHGLVIGATGSGKSELLRTLVTGLAMTHSPEELNLVLVDFKGGATFSSLGALPHTAALITNLEDDLTLVDRMHDAVAGELVRRQEVLRDAGDVARVTDLPRGGQAVPSLLVVVDEFTELLVTRPDLAELFASIGRVGRSLGVHLLLASQRLDEGRLRGLESHLGFRIALRTHTAAESRAVIGSADAHELPPRPGAGLLATGPGAVTRFQTLLVSAPEPRRTVGRTVLPFTSAPVRDPSSNEHVEPALLERVVAEARHRAHDGRAARRIWLPPLREAPELPRLLASVPDPGVRRLPVGLVDLPRAQRHAPLLLDLAGAGGHVAIVGAPRSGRTTLLRTIGEALAASAPTRTRLALVDLGGGLTRLARLPQVSSCVGRGEPEELRRLADDLMAEAARRRRDRANDPDLFVLVDGWAALREGWPDVEAALAGLAQESLSFGIHLVLTATRWADLRLPLRDVIGTRLELRLGDPVDSGHGRARAAAVPTMPGHGLTPDGHPFLAAVPGEAVSDGRRP